MRRYTPQIDFNGETKAVSISLVPENFRQLFPLNMIKGSAESALSEPGVAVISSRQAERLFGDKDPIGQRIEFTNGSELTVAGVFDSMPERSFLEHWEIIASTNSFDLLNTNDEATTVRRGSLYFHRTKAMDLERIGHQATELTPPSDDDRRRAIVAKSLVKSLSDFLARDTEEMQVVFYVLIFALSLCLTVLLISCINFINLTTARQTQRQLEVGIRKTAGAFRGQLIGQFFTETLVMVLAAVSIAIPLILGIHTWMVHITN